METDERTIFLNTLFWGFGLRKEFTTFSVTIPGIEGDEKRQTMKAVSLEIIASFIIREAGISWAPSSMWTRNAVNRADEPNRPILPEKSPAQFWD
jgi:hypothetical protein